MTEKSQGISVAAITGIVGDKTLDCELFMHGDHSHGIEYTTCNVISEEAFLEEFAVPFQQVRTDLRGQRKALDEQKRQIDELREELRSELQRQPEKIKDILEISLSDDAPFFRNLRKITTEHAAEVGKVQGTLQKKIDEHFQQVQKQRQYLETFQKSCTDRFQELEKLKDLATGMERAQQELWKKLNEADERNKALLERIRVLEEKAAAQKTSSEPSSVDIRKLENRIAALEKASGPSSADIRKLEKRIASLETGRNVPAESSFPPSPAQERGFLQRLCDFFRFRE